MNFFALSGLINGITSTVLGIFVFSRNRKEWIYRTYVLFCLSVALWSYFYFAWQIALTPQSALFCSRGLMAGAIFIPIFYLHHVLELLKLAKEKKRLIVFGYAFGIISLFLDFTPYFVKGVSAKLQFKYWPDPGIAYHVFLLIWLYFVLYGMFILVKSFRKSRGFKRNQLKYVILATIFGWVGGITNYPLWYGVKILPIGNIFVSAYVFIAAYAIVKYRLMDIKVALTRTSIFICVYTLILGLPFAAAIWLKDWLIEFFGAYWWMSPLILMAALATVGPFIYIYIDRKAEKRLLREQRRYQDTLKQASLGMTRIRNLRRLLDLIAHIVTKTVRISYTAIYLYDQENEEYVLQVCRDKGRASIPKLTLDNPLIRWLFAKRQPLIYEEVKRIMEDTADAAYRLLEENMRLLTATVIIPNFLEDDLLGFIVLGEKLSGQIYTPEDLNVFQVLASQAALAIENAQFYEETKEMQERIATAEKMATIGTMADGLSHQINNRFYALSLIAGDTIDTIKITDTSKCTPEVRQMIKSVSHALGRIQANVIQGGEVVKGILKYTRRGDEGFEALSLDQILDGTLEMVQYKVKLSEIDLVRDYPKDLAKIRGNQVQLQEVFFNFIDNGYDAIVERGSLLKEEGYRGRITVSAHPNANGMLEIRVQDNGIGIKQESSKKIFTPFFTTKASSQKGTGLGLYVIRRIITDTHKGKISFESTYKVGTRFIIELPIAK